MNRGKSLRTTGYWVRIGVFSAVAFVLQLMGKFLPKVGGFLDIEFSDLPAIILSFAEGPIAGLLTELIKNLIHLTVTSTGGIGELANFLVNGVFVLTAGVIYLQSKTKTNAVIALAVSTIVLAFAAFYANLYILLPLYMSGVSMGDKLTIITFTITPFNLAKGAVLSVITMLIYKKISIFIKKQ